MAEIKKHGQPGYRRGCRCATCRAGHAAAVAEWRARKREREAAAADPAAAIELPAPRELPPLESMPSLDMTAPAGALEQAIDQDLSHPDSRVAWKNTLLGVAKLNARALDQMPVLNRLDLVSSLELRLLEVLNRLALLGFAGMGDDDGDGATGAGEELAAQAERLLAELDADGA